jgi:hypothetical protein
MVEFDRGWDPTFLVYPEPAPMLLVVTVSCSTSRSRHNLTSRVGYSPIKTLAFLPFSPYLSGYILPRKYFHQKFRPQKRH